MWHIFKEFTFEAAHCLDHLPEGHKCRNLHGHTYLLKVWLEATELTREGWVRDFGEIGRAVRQVLDMVDHTNLNETMPKPTTCEVMAKHIYDLLKVSLPELCTVELWETRTSGCRYGASV